MMCRPKLLMSLRLCRNAQTQRTWRLQNVSTPVDDFLFDLTKLVIGARAAARSACTEPRRSGWFDASCERAALLEGLRRLKGLQAAAPETVQRQAPRSRAKKQRGAREGTSSPSVRYD